MSIKSLQFSRSADFCDAFEINQKNYRRQNASKDVSTNSTSCFTQMRLFGNSVTYISIFIDTTFSSYAITSCIHVIFYSYATSCSYATWCSYATTEKLTTIPPDTAYIYSRLATTFTTNHAYSRPIDWRLSKVLVTPLELEHHRQYGTKGLKGRLKGLRGRDIQRNKQAPRTELRRFLRVRHLLNVSI